MFRIAIIGASSLSLGKKVIDEILQELQDIDLELCLMSAHEDHVRLVADYARRTHPDSECKLVIHIGRDAREAIDGADAVITIFDIGGHRAAVTDHDIAGEFGIGQCIGDTLGPAAVMRSQRVIPVIDELRQDIEELSPDTLLINYVNPLGPIGVALNSQGLKNHIGMCGGPAEMLDSIKVMLGQDELDFRLAGTNHMSWIVSIKNQKGDDLYPKLKERLLQPDIAGKERVRTEILQTFGYFCSESSGQLADMLPWFRNSEESRKLYLASGYAGETGAYPKVTAFLHRHLGRMDFLEQAVPEPLEPINASLSRILRRHADLNLKEISLPVFGNVVNKNRRIENLSESAFVETTLSYENGKWWPEHIIPIPEEVLPLSRRHDENNGLMAEAALSGDPDTLVRAMCLDPLTSSEIGISSIREMTYMYIEMEKEWLPQYRKPEKYQGIDFKDLPRVESTVFDGESFVAKVKRQKKR